MAMNDYPERLPCGVTLEALLGQVADQEPAGDPTHQASCPYCQAALLALRRDWTDVRSLAQQPIEIPAGLTAAIITRIRELTVRLADAILIQTERGDTRISHTAIAEAAQRLAATVPGVVFASAQPTPLDPAHPRRLNLTLRLVVGWTPAITQIADNLRELLTHHVPILTGAEPARIDITVRDITDPSARPPA